MNTLVRPYRLTRTGIRLKQSVKQWSFTLALGAVWGIGSMLPATAAERLGFQYGPIVRSIELESLETFAETGVVTSELESYFNLANVNETQQAEFRAALQNSVDLDPVLVSRFFRSNIGDRILTQFLGDLIRTEAGLNSKYAIRSALVLAANDEQGLSLLNFLRYLPVNIRLDLDKVLGLSEAITTVVEGTEYAIATMDQLSTAEAVGDPPVDFAALPDPSQSGPFEVAYQRWTLTDESRDRTLYVDVFQPQQARSEQTPVVVISHGLASNPEAFWKRAEHLASYGYLVALPQHPGSDLLQAERFRQGLSNNIFQVEEFIDRPKDISFVLDMLEQRSASELDGVLDLDNVGVIGHSFGGYTALALAGAVPDFEFLAQECAAQFNYINISRLLQCEALELPQQTYDFRDPRVAAVIAMNPVNSSIFGPEGLSQVTIPVAIAAGSYDPATPAVFEQFQTFPWLGSSEKYLGLIEGQAHVDFSQVDAGVTDAINSIEGLTLASPSIIDYYEDALTLIFFEIYVAENPEYRAFLESDYSAYLSQDQEFKIYVISEESTDELEAAIEVFKDEYDID
ncbi:MAG: alpha/beta hydrolase [Thainema sp.]